MLKQYPANRDLRSRIPMLLAAVALLACTCGAAQAGDGDLVVVAYKDAGLADVTADELGKLFLAQTGEIGGARIKAVNLGDDLVKPAFYTSLTGMSYRDVEDHFVALDLRGEGGWPPEVGSADALVKLLVKYKKAVGWMTMADLDAMSERARSLLAVVAVDGKKPGEAGYVLSE